jgi:hypothetical protein
MNLDATIAELRSERNRLDDTIRTLERLAVRGERKETPNRRGRRPTGDALAKKEASRRMNQQPAAGPLK